MQTTTTPATTPQSTSTPTKPPETQQKIQSSWYGRGFSCELWIDPPEQVRRDFRHDVDELVLLVDGLAQIELGGKVVKMQPGDEMTWSSDGSQTNDGFTICAEPTTAGPSSAWWSLTSGNRWCTLEDNCASDGPGDHGNGEACTFVARRTVTTV